MFSMCRHCLACWYRMYASATTNRTHATAAKAIDDGCQSQVVPPIVGGLAFVGDDDADADRAASPSAVAVWCECSRFHSNSRSLRVPHTVSWCGWHGRSMIGRSGAEHAAHGTHASSSELNQCLGGQVLAPVAVSAVASNSSSQRHVVSGVIVWVWVCVLC